mmetsp:Transcript_24579/g.62223  ORF Transcript_24579/g.62223 Transcript_24579/m.62223 type:complete len:449 (-) Transcript_24579:168-1514(-)
MVICAVAYVEFDNKIGPKIVRQHPDQYIPHHMFEALSEYLICPPQLAGRMVSLSAFGKHIMGLPQVIEDGKYSRNQLLFNLAFVVHGGPDVKREHLAQHGISLDLKEEEEESHDEELEGGTGGGMGEGGGGCGESEVEALRDCRAQTVQYEGVVKKLSSILRTMEVDNEYLTREETRAPFLDSVLPEIMHRLNNGGVYVTHVGEGNLIALTIPTLLPPKRKAKLHNVPVITHRLTKSMKDEVDLTTQGILHHIDGVNFNKKIAMLSKLEDEAVVLKAVDGLVERGWVDIVDIFQFRNVYRVTAPCMDFVRDSKALLECARYACAPNADQTEITSSVLLFLSSLDGKRNVSDVMRRLGERGKQVDARRLITFCILNGFVYRTHQYPVWRGRRDGDIVLSEMVEVGERLDNVLPTCDGTRTLDEICVELGMVADMVESYLTRCGVLMLRK